MMEENNLPELPKGWVWTRLGNIAYKITDGSHNPPPKQEKGIPMLSARNIFNNKIDFENVRYILEEDYQKEFKRTPIELGDVLLTIVGTIGRSTVVKFKTPRFAIQRSVSLIKSKIDSEYLPYYFQSNFCNEFLLKNAKGTAQQGVYLNQLYELHVPLPPLPEQHRIVAKIEELFTKRDAGVEALKKVKMQLKRYRQAVLKHAFEGKLTEEWQEIHTGEIEPASVLLERIREERKRNAKGKYKELPPLDTSDLPELPGGWVRTRLEGICLDPQYGWTTSATSEGTLHLLRTTDITSGNIDWESVPFCKKDPPEKEKYLLKDGDIVISRAGSIGYSHLIKNPKEAVFASYLIRFKPLIDEKYLAYFLKSPSYWESISEKSLGIAIPNVNASKLKQIIIPLPPLPEQQHKIVEEIERRLFVADEVEKVMGQSLKRAERLRQSILKRAFEGKLVPQDPSDEPAEKLLERIKAEKAKQEAKRKVKRRIKRKRAQKKRR